jgi:hypothetical protein
MKKAAKKQAVVHFKSLVALERTAVFLCRLLQGQRLQECLDIGFTEAQVVESCKIDTSTGRGLVRLSKFCYKFPGAVPTTLPVGMLTDPTQADSFEAFLEELSKKVSEKESSEVDEDGHKTTVPGTKRLQLLKTGVRKSKSN